MLSHGHSVMGLEQLVNVKSFSRNALSVYNSYNKGSEKLFLRHRSELYASRCCVQIKATKTNVQIFVVCLSFAR
jgi:hypothetical protein